MFFLVVSKKKEQEDTEKPTKGKEWTNKQLPIFRGGFIGYWVRDKKLIKISEKYFETKKVLKKLVINFRTKKWQKTIKKKLGLKTFKKKPWINVLNQKMAGKNSEKDFFNQKATEKN